MFDVSLSELFLIGLVALIVLGPKRLPEVARAGGRWMARMRRFVADVKQDFDRELRQTELIELRRLKQELDETRRAVEDTSGKLFQQLAATPEPTALLSRPVSSAPAPRPSPEAAPAARRRGRRAGRPAKETKPHGRAKRTRRR